MKKLLAGLTLLALLNVGAKAQINTCIGGSNSVCQIQPSIAFLAITNNPITVCAGEPIYLCAVYTNIPGQEVMTITNSTDCAITTETNVVWSSVLSNSWIATVGNVTNAGSGLCASFTPTNGGNGTIKFRLTYVNNIPCNEQGETITNTVELTVNLESGPHTNAWECIQQGTTNNLGTLDRTNINVCIGETIVPPVVSGVTFNNGKKKRYIQYDCPQNTNLNHWETNDVIYAAGNIYFVPELPNSINNASTNEYVAKIDGIAIDGICSNITGIVVETVRITTHAPPTIVTQPTDQTVSQGSDATFVVVTDIVEPQLPSVSSGALKLWLKADAGVVTSDGRISEWRDQSSNNNHAFQSDTNQQPILISSAVPTSFRRVVRFDGIQSSTLGDYMQATGDVGLDAGFTAFLFYNPFHSEPDEQVPCMIGEVNEVSATRGYYMRSFTSIPDEMAFGAWANDYGSEFSIPTNTYRIWTLRLDQDMSQLDFYDTDNSSDFSTSVETDGFETPSAGYYLGGLGEATRNFKGDIAEVIYYQGSLSEPDRIEVEDYLRQKYFSTTLTYQWKSNGVAIDGATSSSLTLNNVQPTDEASYNVEISNGICTITSSSAVLTVDVPFTIVSQPSNLTITYGENATFTVTATGNSLGYQWRRNNQNISGATQSAYTAVKPTVAQSGSTFDVIVSSGALTPLTSEAATLTVNKAGLGITADNKIKATGAVVPTLTGTIVGLQTGDNITASYISSVTTNSPAGVYAIVPVPVDPSGKLANYSLTLNSGILTVADRPAITVQPVSINRAPGMSATFTVQATGTPLLTYQWRKDGANILGATGSQFAIGSVSMSDVGNYSVLIENAGGSAQSVTAALIVVDPAIVQEPVDVHAVPGANLSFSVEVESTSTPSFQWQKDDTNIQNGSNLIATFPGTAIADAISGATGSTLNLTKVTTKANGSYRARVSNSSGTNTSEAGTLSVCSIYPIAIHKSVVSDHLAGTPNDVITAFFGTNPGGTSSSGDFGWLAWNWTLGDYNSAPTLATSLSTPNSENYANPQNSTDRFLDRDKYAIQSNGANNSASVKAALNVLTNEHRVITVIVWDDVDEDFPGTGNAGNKTGYRISSFAKIKLIDYSINGHGWIKFTYEGTGKCDDPRNTPPIITLPGSTLTFTENDPAKLIDTGATLVDYDSPDFDGGLMTVDVFSQSSPATTFSEDSLSIFNEGTGNGQIGIQVDEGFTYVTYGNVPIGRVVSELDRNPLKIILNDKSTRENVQALLRRLTYRNTSDNPSCDNRTFQVVMTDGDGPTPADETSEPVTKLIEVVPVNDPPTLSELFNRTVTVGSGSHEVILGGITAGGEESQVLAVSAISEPTTLIDHLSVTYTSPNSFGKLNFTPLAPGVVTITVTVQDSLEPGNGCTVTGGAKSVTRDFQVTILPETVNIPPTITLPSPALVYTVNSPATIIDFASTVGDPDSDDFQGGTLTVGIITAGQIDDVLDIRNQGNGAGQIAVSGSVVSYGGTAIGTYVAGNGTSPLTVTFTSVSATPAAATALLQNLTYRNSSVSPPLALRTLEYLISDGDGGTSASATKDINLVVPINTPPVVELGEPVTYTLGGLPVILSATATISDIDEPDFDSWNYAATITVSLVSNVDDSDRLSFRIQGDGPGEIGGSGTEITYGGEPFGEVLDWGGGSDPLIIHVEGSLQAIQSLLRNLTFYKVAGAPTLLDRQLQLTVQEDGVASGSVPANKIIHVFRPEGDLDIKAGTDQTFEVETLPLRVSLTGEDQFGIAPIVFSWTQVDGPTGVIASIADSTMEQTTVTLTSPGHYEFKIHGLDAIGNEDEDTISIDVTKVRVFTKNSDFDGGALLNLNHDDPNGDQLQINTRATPFPFVNIPWSDTRNKPIVNPNGPATMIRIDANTGVILGEYNVQPRHPDEFDDTFFTQLWGQNQGLAVDKDGNAWMGTYWPNSGYCKIGLVIGGTRGRKNPDGSFTPDLKGDYLKPPFLYNTCIDRDHDGYIKTSRGRGHILPWRKDSPGRGPVDVSLAEDEAIVAWIPTPLPTFEPGLFAQGQFTLNLDVNGNIWSRVEWDDVELLASEYFHCMIDPRSGLELRISDECMPGGMWTHEGSFDANNNFWTGGFGLFQKTSFNGSALEIECINVEDDFFSWPGITMDPRNGQLWYSYVRAEHIYLSKINDNGNLISEYEVGSSVLDEPEEQPGNRHIWPGITKIDTEGNAWVVMYQPLNHDNWIGQKLYRYSIPDNDEDDPAFIGEIPLNCQNNLSDVSFDSNGKVWVRPATPGSLIGETALRIDPVKGTSGEVDLAVYLGGSDGNYQMEYHRNFDMTGAQVLSTSGSGIWTVVHDDGIDDTEWSRIFWNHKGMDATRVFDAGIKVEARAANSAAGLPAKLFREIEYGELIEDGDPAVPSLVGRFVEIRVTLKRHAEITDPLGPQLKDLVIESSNIYSPDNFPGAEEGAIPPALVDDQFIDENAILRNSTGTDLDVLANDEDDPSLIIRDVTQPANGWVDISVDGKMLSYTPDIFWFGSDTFTYTVANAAGGVARARVQVEVSLTADTTEAIDDVVSVPVLLSASLPRAITLDVIANDLNHGLQPLRFARIGRADDVNDWDARESENPTPPDSTAPYDTDKGKIEVIGDESDSPFCPKKLIYTPNGPGVVGEDYFDYEIVDEEGTKSIAHVTINIYNSIFEQPLVAKDLVVVTDPETPKTIQVFNGFFDNPRQATVVQVEQPIPSAHGTVGTPAPGATHITYTSDDFAGVDKFSYTVEDVIGVRATGTVTVFVRGDNNDPTAVDVTQNVKRNSRNNLIEVLYSDSDAGDLLEIFSHTQPEHGEVVLKEGELLYTPDRGYSGEDSFTYWIADYTETAGVISYKGGLGEAVVTLNVTEGSGVLPIARITKPVKSDYSAGGAAANYARIREGILTVEGTASHPDTAEAISYELVISTVDGDEVLRHSSETRVVDDVLGEFDLSGLRNGVYDLWLTVQGGDEFAEDSVSFILESDLKVGQFTFSEQDAAIPARGMPLTVVRTYDSLNPNKGDFGYSWSMAINSMDVELDEYRRDVLGSVDDIFSPEYFSMRVGGGRNVTLTLPDGRRTTFVFTLIKDPEDDSGLSYVPKFIAPPGVNAKLETQRSESLKCLPSGVFPPFWRDGESKIPEAGYDFRDGFILTTEDGTEYVLTREKLPEGDPNTTYTVVPEPDGDDDLGEFSTFEVKTYGTPELTQINFKDGSKVYLSDTEVLEKDPSDNVVRKLVFVRSDDGRILSVTDPVSAAADATLPLIKYNYDTQKRLVSVEKLVDRDNSNPNLRYQITSSYGYHSNPELKNYITEVRDGRGVPLTRNEYYAEGAGVDSRDVGRLMSVQAPDGTRTVFERVYPADDEGVPNTEFTDLNQGDSAVAAIEKIIVHPAFDGTVPSDDSGIVTIHCTDAKGNVLYSTDHLDNTVKRTYDSHNNITEERRIIDGGSQDIITTYERVYTTSLLTKTDIIDSEIVTAPKNSSGELIQTKTTFDDNGRPKKSYDGKNFASGAFYTENSYDSNGQLQHTKAYKNGAELLTLSESVYHSLGRFSGFLDYTEDAGGTRTYHEYYDSGETGGRFGDLKRIVVKHEDDLSTPLSDVSYEYDANGNQTKEIKVLNAQATVAETENFYDDQGRLKETEDAEGGVSETLYNSFGKVDNTEDRYGNQTSYVYGPNGDLIKTTYPDGSIVRTVTRNVRIDDGTVKRWKEVISEERHFPVGHARYDANEPIRGSRSISDEIGRQIRSERLSNVDISLDEVPTGELPRNTGLTIYKTTFNDADVLSWTETKYNAAGQIESTEQGYTDGGPQTVPTVSTYFYDGNGRRNRVQTHLRNGAGDGDDEYTQTFTLFDHNGNQTHFCTIPGQTTTPPGISDGRWTRYDYDDFNRRTKTSFPFLTGQDENSRYFSKTRYDILGQRIEEIDKAGISTGFGYDKLGHLITVTNGYRVYTDAAYETTFAASPDQTITRYEYDWVGNMTAQFDANQEPLAVGSRVATRLDYDKLGRRLSRTLPGTTAENPTEPLVETFRYDFTTGANGKQLQQTERTDFNGTIVLMDYDEMGRLVNKEPTGGTTLPTGGDAEVSFTYDANGRRLTMIDGSGDTGYTYDNQGRLHTRTRNIGAELSYVQTYDYDGLGNLNRIRITHDTVTYDQTYNWDELNRLKHVFPTATPVKTTDYSYDDFGNLETVTYPTTAPTVTSYLYDKQHRLTDMYVGTAANPSSLADFDYTSLGKTGNRLSAVERIDTSTRTVDYTYDDLYRLKLETLVSGSPATGTITYDATPGYGDNSGYDRVGNRRSRTLSLSSAITGFANQTLGYDANDRLTGAGNESDLNGNTRLGAVPTGAIVPETGHEDEYDYENRLIKRSNGTATGDTTITIVYDGDGNRVKKTVVVNGGDTTTTFFAVDDRNPSGYAQVLVEWKKENSNPVGLDRTYVYGHDLISQKPAGGSDIYYGYDGHGNTRFLINASGNPTGDTYTYDAFGTLIESSGTTVNAYLYCGEQYDADLGFYYLRARYLNPGSGRFWTMDSYEGNSSDPLTLHKYLYCHANPVNNIDPSGHTSFPDILASMAIQYTLSSIVAPALSGAFEKLGKAIIPRQIYDAIVNRQKPNAFMVGASGALSVGRLGAVIAGAVSVESLWSIRNFNNAVYASASVSGSTGASGPGKSLSGYAGLVWRCPDSAAYTGNSLSVTLTGKIIPQKLLDVLADQLAANATAMAGAPQVSPGSFPLPSELMSALENYKARLRVSEIVNNLSVTVSWSPGGTGAFSVYAGFDVAGGGGPRGTGGKAVIAFSHYWQVIPSGEKVTF
jgi:RHS repeat-associated protein